MTLIEILLTIIIVLFSIIAIRISFKFDLNSYLRDRRKIKINQLKNICPHSTGNFENGKLHIISFFSSPSMTRDWICSQCGLIVSSEEDTKRLMQRYLTKPIRILEDQKKFRKKAKKLKIL